MAEVEILHPGLFTSIQDRGRFGYRQFGVPTAGVMDLTAAGMANLLLQNVPDAAVMEITLQGPKMKFLAAAEIVITGAELSPELDSVKLLNNKVYRVETGQVISFGKRTSGYRAYLGISGGFQTEVILNSRSWSPGITSYSRMEKGMKIPFLEGKDTSDVRFSSVRPDVHMNLNLLEAYPGPEYELLGTSKKEALEKMTFSAGKDSNRMGIQFEEKLENFLDPIITSPVIPGTVQLTPSGTLIVLMRDGQTTGGYPRILQLTEASLNILAQKLPGERLQIKLINYQ